jgi:hypothetical protein
MASIVRHGWNRCTRLPRRSEFTLKSPTGDAIPEDQSKKPARWWHRCKPSEDRARIAIVLAQPKSLGRGTPAGPLKSKAILKKHKRLCGRAGLIWLWEDAAAE